MFWNLESVSCLRRGWLLNPQSYTWTFHKHPLTACSHIGYTTFTQPFQNIHSIYEIIALSFTLRLNFISWINTNKHMANQSKIKLFTAHNKQASRALQHYLLLLTWHERESVCVVLFPVISQTDWQYRCLGALSLLMNIQNINMNINILKMESYKCTVQLAIVTGTNCLSMQRCV